MIPNDDNCYAKTRNGGIDVVFALKYIFFLNIYGNIHYMLLILENTYICYIMEVKYFKLFQFFDFYKQADNYEINLYIY